MHQTDINVYIIETALISYSNLYIVKKNNNTYYNNIRHIYFKTVIKIKNFSKQNIGNSYL